MPRKKLTEYTLIFLSGALYAIALKYFVLPAEVVLTGTEGIAAALSYYFDNYSLFIILYLVFQIILLSFAWFKISKTFTFRSALVVGTVVFLLATLPDLEFADPKSERMLLVIFGGIIAGFAKAVAFKNRGSTGDEDILGAYFSVKYLKPVGSIAIMAAVVSTTFGLGLDLLKYGEFESVLNTLMYTCIYIFASAETLNNLYHKFQITQLTVITLKKEAVAEAVKATRPHRTYTVHEGMGGHSGLSYGILKTIVTMEEQPGLIMAIEKADPECFHYSMDIEEVSSHFAISPIE
jgi:uncharacterized membrane-anchored protein YitT (DUF2179 family)